MSDASAGAGQSQGQSQGQAAPQGEAQGQGSAEGQQSEYSLAEGFLGRVPQEHRSIIEPYVKQWDAGVTRRFAELHSQLQPYTELGDLETLQAAAGLAQMLEENPYQVYGILHQALMNGEMIDPQSGQPFQQPGQQLGQQPGQQFQQPPGQQMLPGQAEQGLAGQELPPAVAARFDQLTNAVIAMGQHILGQQQTTQEESEDQALDEWLGSLHEEYGDFDEQWVLGRILNGEEPEAAIQGFNQLITDRASSQLNRQSGLPNLLGAGGGGGAPADPTNVKNLSRKQTQGLVASVLASNAAAKNGQQ
jgi:hypothetical protein